MAYRRLQAPAAPVPRRLHHGNGRIRRPRPQDLLLRASPSSSPSPSCRQALSHRSSESISALCQVPPSSASSSIRRAATKLPPPEPPWHPRPPCSTSSPTHYFPTCAEHPCCPASSRVATRLHLLLSHASPCIVWTSCAKSAVVQSPEAAVPRLEPCLSVPCSACLQPLPRRALHRA